MVMDKLKVIPELPKITNAPCKGLTEQFFIIATINKTGPKKTQIAKEIRETKAICEGCEFRKPCVVGAIERSENVGIWGGVNFFNRYERREVMKRYKDGTL